MEKQVELKQWKIRGNEELSEPSGQTLRKVLNGIVSNLSPQSSHDHDDRSGRAVIHMGQGDPTPYSCFRTAPEVEDAVVDALRSAAFNGYSSSIGILPARRAVAEYLSRDLPYELSADDVFLTVGCEQSIEVVLAALASPGANILLPRPGYPYYESRASHSKLQVRHFDLLPEREWEVDLDSLEALADDNTVAMVIVNPGNPSGSVYLYQHLQKVVETARKLGILVIADEVYGHLTFGSNPFVPMGVFGSIAPVITLGSLSKRWIVPGWRLGWLVTTDPNGILKEYGVTESIRGFLNISSDPATFIQGAVPQILEKTKDDFFSRIQDILRKDVDICWEKLKHIPCIPCPYKPQGGMFAMVKLDTSMLDGIKDDTDFCKKLAKEESVIVLPGVVTGMKNWLRICIALEPALVEEAFDRIKAFCKRHAKKQHCYKRLHSLNRPIYRDRSLTSHSFRLTIQGLNIDQLTVPLH